MKTKRNWRKLKKIILLSNILEFLKFLIEKKIIKKDKLEPKTNEQNPIKLGKIYFSSNAAFTSGGI